MAAREVRMRYLERLLPERPHPAGYPRSSPHGNVDPLTPSAPAYIRPPLVACSASLTTFDSGSPRPSASSAATYRVGLRRAAVPATRAHRELPPQRCRRLFPRLPRARRVHALLPALPR